MARSENPYRPGFNEPPRELAGRELVLEDLDDAVEVAALDHRTPRPVLLAGPRGMGKTVLLAQAAAIAGSRFGWPRVHVEIRPETPFTPDLVDALGRAHELVEQPRDRHALRTQGVTLRAGIPGVGGEVRFERADESPGDSASALRPALLALVQLAETRDSGFVLTLDEAHLAARRELAALAALLQEGIGERWPIVVVIAGLPLMRAPEHSVTYLERGTWHELGLLDPRDTVRALRLPADAAGRPMDEDAAALLAAASGGYPYAIQLYGHHAWRTSADHQRIDLDAARAALPRAQGELERGLYAARWTAASPSQRRYLAALAAVARTESPATARAVADQLHRTPKQLSSVRDDLIKAGTLTVEGDELRFTIPGMSDYVQRQAPPEEPL
ncbi:MAG TPA: ATP-binding protein [Solirubrobacteraceae bacterium]|nr:ATP-binding protein [Solirubrobacteraceae bacterium]